MENEPLLDVIPQSSGEALPPPVAPRPALWPAFVVPVSAFACAAFGGGLLLVIFLAITQGPEIVQDASAIKNAIAQASASTIGFLVVTLPSEISYLVAAIGAALISGRRWAPQLNFRSSTIPWWSLPLLALGTPFVTSLGGIAQRLCFDMPSEQLERLGQMTTASGDGIALAPIFVLGILAPFAEETLFRGYVQQRLLKRWRPWLAITVSTVLFLLAHWEPAHMVAILPLGFWLGIIAWRTQSLWPAVLCHAAQNLLFVFANQLSLIGSRREAMLILGLISMITFAISVVVLWLHRTHEETADDTELTPMQAPL